MENYIKTEAKHIVVEAKVNHGIQWAIPENNHTPLWTTLNWVPTNFRIFKRRTTAVFAGFQSLLNQNLEEFQNFTKILMVFLEFRLKFAKF